MLASCAREPVLGTRGLEIERRHLLLSGFVSSIALILPISGKGVMGCLRSCGYRIHLSSYISNFLLLLLCWNLEGLSMCSVG